MKSPPRPKVAIVTCAMLQDQGGLDTHDQPLLPALEALGLEPRVARWDDPDVDWSAFTVTLVRSPWDYHQRRDEFLAWTDRVSDVSRLWNPADVLRWNTHKGYLRELADRGVPVIATELVPAGARAQLVQVLAQRGWTEAVIKPAVSAGSQRTIRVGAKGVSIDEGQEHLESVLRTGDALVQPYLATVSNVGERSLIFIDGEPTHAMRKYSAFEASPVGLGDAVPAELQEDEVSVARQVLAALPLRRWLYARVDLLRDEYGRPTLMELEMTEPRLFFLHAPHALARMARAIERLAREAALQATTR